MNKIALLLLLILVHRQTSSIAQDIALFDIDIIEKNKNESVDFISLSDIYPLSEYSDSFAIPNLMEKGPEASKYFKLDPKYRKRFLSKTKISETDVVCIYNYSLDVLVSFSVKNLNIVACLNIYGADWPYSPSDYMIGFEINKKFISGFGQYALNTLVYVGKENPFVQAEMKHIVWKIIAAKDFPSIPANPNDTLGRLGLHEHFKKDTVYKYETGDLQYFIQNWVRANPNYNPNDSTNFAKHLIVVNSKTKEPIFSKIFLTSESGGFTPMNQQWTGKLFKNKPPVIFGFLYHSFGCPEITLLKDNELPIPINCDNRH